MKLIVLHIFILFSCKAFGQNIILPDGEFMDTTSNHDKACKDYNWYYYQVGGKYPQSSTTLLKEAQQFLLKKNESYSDSGYITFRFKINCEGKMVQKVQVLQTDEKYSSYHFDKNLVNELYTFIKTLDRWKTVKTKEGEPLLYKAFITFKIKNGKVVNIIP